MVRKFIKKHKLFDVVGPNLNSVEVVTETRTLRATWTPELAQDVSAFHGIDIEDELLRLLNEELNRETERETINTIDAYIQPIQPIQTLNIPITINFGEPTVLDDGSWFMGNHFESVLGPTISLRELEF